MMCGRKRLFLFAVIGFLYLSSAEVYAASTDCNEGYEFSPRFILCIQSDCNEVEHAHYSYTGYCICGSSGSVNEKPEDPNKACARAEDYPGCPGCIYACVHLDENCPDEEPKTATANESPAVSSVIVGGGDETENDEVSQRYGVVEEGGRLYINTPPNGTLNVKLKDLPPWAYGEIVTIGAMVHEMGSISTIVSGDPSATFEGIPIVRKGDWSSHGGKVEDGSDRIFINGVPAAKQGGFVSCPEWHVPLHNPEHMMPHIGGYIRGGVPLVVDDINLTPCINCDEIPVREEHPGLTQDQFCQRLKNRMATHYIASVEYGMAADAFMEFCKDWKYGRTNIPTGRGTYKLEMDSKGFLVGDNIIIGTEKNHSEQAKVTKIGSLILGKPLKNDYPAGTHVFKMPREIPPELQVFFKAEFGEKGGSGFVYMIFAVTGIIGLLAIMGAIIISAILIYIFLSRRKQKKTSKKMI